MQDKQKVTLYLPPELHRKLKIRAAVDSEPMSTIAERAIVFYMTHPGVVDEVESSYGRSHRVYSCPECSSSIVINDGEMVTLKNQPSILADEGLTVDSESPPSPPLVKGGQGGSKNKVQTVNTSTDQQGEQQLVPC